MSLGPTKCAAAALIIGVCSACGGTAATPANERGYVAVGPAPRERSKTFEYFANNYGTRTIIFDYPKSENQVGELVHAAGAMCTNVLYGYGKKVFWMVMGTKMIEFKVPKKPIKTLSIFGGTPENCAMSASGDLAVSVMTRSGGTEVIVFGQRHITTIKAPASVYFMGYDGRDDLFIDGFTDGSSVGLSELPEGARRFEQITLGSAPAFPGSVQWDGSYLVITDQQGGGMNRYTIEGSHATLEGTVRLTGAGDCASTWIATGVVFCADAGDDNAKVFAYPAGGSAIATLEGHFDLPLDTVAVAQ